MKSRNNFFRILSLSFLSLSLFTSSVCPMFGGWKSGKGKGKTPVTQDEEQGRRTIVLSSNSQVSVPPQIQPQLPSAQTFLASISLSFPQDRSQQQIVHTSGASVDMDGFMQEFSSRVSRDVLSGVAIQNQTLVDLLAQRDQVRDARTAAMIQEGANQLLSSVSGDIEAAQNSIENRVGQVDSHLGEVDVRVGDLAAQVQVLQEQVGQVDIRNQEAVAGLDKRIQDINTAVESLKQSIGEKFEQYQQSLNKLQESLDGLQNDYLRKLLGYGMSVLRHPVRTIVGVGATVIGYRYLRGRISSVFEGHRINRAVEAALARRVLGAATDMAQHTSSK